VKSVFNELMSGLDDVEPYLAGETERPQSHLSSGEYSSGVELGRS
jgi:hypothetical protein